MSDYYNPLAKRNVTSADFNTYIYGQLHPDRVMNEHDFVYILSGSWEIYQDEKPYLLFPDDMILLHAGRHHYGIKPCTNNTKTMYIHVTPDEGDYFPNDFSIQLDTVISCQNNLKIKSIFQEILSTFRMQLPHKKIKSSTLFGLLICEIKECIDQQIHPIDSLVEEIIQCFLQTQQTFFSTKELAKKYYVSEKTLNKRFQKIYNKSIYQYQVDLKLEHVQRFLYEYPNMKLHEMAITFGFYDEFHLSKMFKKHFGLSPKDYRAYKRNACST